MRSNYKLLSEELEAVLDHLPALVFYKDRDNRFLLVNKYVADAYGKTKTEMEGQSLSSFHDEETAERYHRDDLEVMASGDAKLNYEEEWRTAGGTRWVSTSKIPYFDADGRAKRIIGISIDITEKKHADALIQELIHRLEHEKRQAQENSLTDSLTQIPNRRYFDSTFKKEYFRLKRTKSPISILMIDIDYFKKYNDALGHVAGDACLKAVAACIQQCLLRPGDFAARYGGEEFCILLPDTDLNGADVMARRIVQAIADRNLPHPQSEASDRVSVSIGALTVFPSKLDNPDGLVAIADKALYRAKSKGRNRVELDFLYPDLDDLSGERGYISLSWNLSNISGCKELDLQHKSLIELSNRIIEKASAKAPIAETKADIERLLDQLKEHFAYEIDFLEKIQYPAASEHASIHESLLEKANRMMTRYRDGTANLHDLLRFMVFDVAFEHMDQEDKKFFDFIPEDRKGAAGE